MRRVECLLPGGERHVGGCVEVKTLKVVVDKVLVVVVVVRVDVCVDDD